MESNATGASLESGPEEARRELRKRLTAHLAQRLTLSLFIKGKEQELRDAITRVVAAKLQEDHITLAEAEQAALVDELIAGLPKTNPLQPVQDQAQHIVWTVDSLRQHVAPYIADHLGNHLFQPGREAQLAEAVYMLVQEKIRVDSIEAGDGLKRGLIEAICQGMGIPLPSALNPSVPPPVKAATPPPVPPLEPPPDGHEEKSDTRMLELEEAPPVWHDLTPEFRREILLHMGSRLKPEILAGSRPDAAHIHVAELLGGAVQEFHVRLTEEEREEILATILSGGGVEFQL